MSNHRKKKIPKDENLPPLGKILSWVDRPGSLSLIIKALVVLCIGLFLADFTFGKYGHFDFEKIYGFYGAFGFIAFTAIVLLARGLRSVIKRPEDYYAPKSVDSEEMPKAQVEEKSHHGA